MDGKNAKKRGRDFWLFFFLSLIINPVIGYIIAALVGESDAIREEQIRNEVKKSPRTRTQPTTAKHPRNRRINSPSENSQTRQESSQNQEEEIGCYEQLINLSFLRAGALGLFRYRLMGRDGWRWHRRLLNSADSGDGGLQCLDGMMDAIAFMDDGA